MLLLCRAMEGLPVTVRLLDPPLHEFLPNDGEALSDLCRSLADVSALIFCQAYRLLIKYVRHVPPTRGCECTYFLSGLQTLSNKACLPCAAHWQI
jgi:pyruvate,orthophosphate dikinase